MGFPGETEEQYQHSLDLISDLRFDKIHCATYSTRPGTTAGRSMEDDVPQDEKVRRREQLEQLQESILKEINSGIVGQEVEVLVEGRYKGKWQGRTRTNKLVYFQSESDYHGQLVNLNIIQASAWSLKGALVSGC